jgi:hypothetical protein
LRSRSGKGVERGEIELAFRDRKGSAVGYSSANATIACPEAMATCCLPSTIYVTGLAAIRPPVGKRHRGLPVEASRAKKCPSSVPPKTRPPAVESRPA